jgi:hypothetical protein
LNGINEEGVQSTSSIYTTSAIGMVEVVGAVEGVVLELPVTCLFTDKCQEASQM